LCTILQMWKKIKGFPEKKNHIELRSRLFRTTAALSYNTCARLSHSHYPQYPSLIHNGMSCLHKVDNPRAEGWYSPQK
jgi:hypothetical protein